MSKVTGRGGGRAGAKVTGTVLVALSPSEAEKLKEGEILITGMTDVDFLAPMARAAAVITDKGGLVCHAAVICAEQGTPFVVGTKTATSAFKTGQKVTVDVDNGEVYEA